MAQKKYTNGSGVAEIWANIKNYITAQLLGKADSIHTHTKSEITDFPTLSTVATSGSYSDLSNKPTIPTVNNATLTIQKNGTNVATFTSNSNTDVTANINVPTKTSDLTNDSFVNRGNNNSIILTWDSPTAGFVNLKVDNTEIGGIITHKNLMNYGFITADYAIPRSGGAVMAGPLYRNNNNDLFIIAGGTNWSNSGSITLFGGNSDETSAQGMIRLMAHNGNTNRMMEMFPNGTWTWNGTACQITSDQRYKQQITEIDDKLLDAWADVELCQFKYNDAVDEKGDKARLHTGYVVQQIQKACEEHGVDISNYGLFCHEEYPEETEEVEVENEDGTKTKERKVIREASEHYSLRYTEALIVECKYLRRCIERLTVRIEELEKGNKEAEK